MFKDAETFEQAFVTSDAPQDLAEVALRAAEAKAAEGPPKSCAEIASR